MSASRLPRVPLMAALVHWLLVVLGLLATSFLRPSGTEWGAFLWGGALLGTALGQLFAKGRLRPWLVGVIVVAVLWFVVILMAPFSAEVGWGGVEVAMMAFLPAIACGYASLSERGAVLAFWFPAVLFMLPILEGAPLDVDSRATPLVGADATWLLLSVLSALFLAFLRARETRRVALWQSSASVRLSLAKPATVLQRAPLRSVAQWGFVSATAAGALTLTALVAPYLWQEEKLASQVAPLAAQGQGYGEGQQTVPTQAGGVVTDGVATDVQATCCPEVAPAIEVERDRFKEYFPVRPHTHETPAQPVQPAGCVVCGHAGPATAPALGAGSMPVAPSSATTPNATATGTPTATPTPTPAPNANLAPAPTPTPTPTPTPNANAEPTPATGGPELPAGHSLRVPRAVLRGTPIEEHPLRWLLTGAASLLAFELLLRPFRRALTLRHLRSPLWRESVDQRVSNLWQLALVGLRDAGYCAARGEQPEELARRVAVPGMESCATVLERARHGVRVDANDLDVMTREASVAYAEARKNVGWVPRAASWIRWPLV